MALRFIVTGEYAAARELLERARSVATCGGAPAQTVTELKKMATLYNNYGCLLAKQGAPDKAAAFFENARAAERTFKSSVELAIALSNAATLAAQSGKLQAASEAGLQAVGLLERRLG